MTSWRLPAVGTAAAAALLLTAGTAVAAPADPDRCRWYAAAIRLAGSLEDETARRADDVRAELASQGITADSELPTECRGSAEPRPPVDRDSTGANTGRPGGAGGTGSAGQQLEVDGREFTRGGERFFWLGDTAWSLFVNLDRAETERYLDTRAEQGFTVIQAVAIFPQAGGPGPNQYGDSPFGSGLDDLTVTDGAQPDDDAQYDYWDHVNYVVEEAGARGLVVGILPVWADTQAGSLVTTGNAAAYGEFLGARFGGADNVVWIMGGDAPADGVEDVWRELAAGIEVGGGDQPMTYHPRGDQSSTEWFGGDDWIDFHMVQGGHCLRYDVRTRLLGQTYAAGKPFLDGEPIYEDHPYCWDNPPEGYSTDLDVRRDAWWAVLGGAAGHTYGHHAVWQFLADGRGASLGGRGSWTEALGFPAAGQMRHVRALIESRPRLEPTNELLADEGSGAARIVAASDAAGTTLVAYTAAGRPVALDLSGMTGSQVQPSWYDPRTGESTELDPVGTNSGAEFAPPDNEDWVLVVDAADLPRPGGTTRTGPTGGAEPGQADQPRTSDRAPAREQDEGSRAGQEEQR